MKYWLTLLLLGTAFIRVAVSQTPNPSAPFISPQAKELYLKMNSGLPLEMKHVVYFMNDTSASTLTPAYVDLSTMTAYSWAGVTLQPDQIPRYFTNHTGPSGVIFPKDPSKSDLQFKEIDPPTFYMLLPDGKYAAGYFDNGNGIYYQWGDLEFDKSQLPADAVSKNRILPLQGGTVSVIPPPSKDAKNSSDAATQAPSKDEASSRFNSTTPAASSSLAPKPIAQVQLISETGLPWWLYGIIILSFASIIGAVYYVSKRSSR